MSSPNKTSSKLLALLQSPDYRPQSAEKIAKQLKIAKSTLSITLTELIKNGMVEVKRGKVHLIFSQDLLVLGVIRVHPRGFGFLVPDEREKYPEDIFVPRPLIAGAVDGDTVEVQINTASISEKGPEGRVVNIIRRGHSHVGGTITSVSKNGVYAYIPLLGLNQTMRIQTKKDEALKTGDRIVVEVLEWGSEKQDSVGKVAEIIGHISDPSCDVKAATTEFNLASSFPAAVLEEVAQFGTKVTPKDAKGREDFRELECLTIDPDEAKDYDDAISLAKDEKGHYNLAVHIADVSHYVKPGTALDTEAKSRCNSVYFPGTVLPMLPHELSSHLCSLMPEKNRLTISVLMHLDETGTLLSYKICRSVICSQKRFTYKEAKLVIDGHKQSKHKPTLMLLVELLGKLKKKRAERGSIEFALPDVELKVDKSGMPERIEIVEYDVTHQLVEECMLMANQVVATHLAKAGKLLPYRVHEEPNPENIKEFCLLANALGFKIPVPPTAEDLQRLFDEARDSPFGQFLATSFIRSMKLAAYSIENAGHYGLGLEFYTHFTSPIRRYVDLIIHRLLFDEVSEDEDMEKIALQCSEKERLSAKAENSVVLLKKLRLLEKMLHDDPYHAFDAVVTGIKPFGFAFAIPTFLMDGFLALPDLDEDYFFYEESKRRLRGKHTGRVYATGDKISVMLQGINLITLETKWYLVTSRDQTKKKNKR